MTWLIHPNTCRLTLKILQKVWWSDVKSKVSTSPRACALCAPLLLNATTTTTTTTYCNWQKEVLVEGVCWGRGVLPTLTRYYFLNVKTFSITFSLLLFVLKTFLFSFFFFFYLFLFLSFPFYYFLFVIKFNVWLITVDMMQFDINSRNCWNC